MVRHAGWQFACESHSVPWRYRGTRRGLTTLDVRDQLNEDLDRFGVCAVVHEVAPNAADDEESVDWVRRFYQRVFADTGGMPVPGDRYDGCYINYPDIDSKDPAWNRSGVPWSTLYYKQSYPRLQRIKAKYDPNNIFRHALSIEPAAG